MSSSNVLKEDTGAASVVTNPLDTGSRRPAAAPSLFSARFSAASKASDTFLPGSGAMSSVQGSALSVRPSLRSPDALLPPLKPPVQPPAVELKSPVPSMPPLPPPLSVADRVAGRSSVAPLPSGYRRGGLAMGGGDGALDSLPDSGTPGAYAQNNASTNGGGADNADGGAFSNVAPMGGSGPMRRKRPTIDEVARQLFDQRMKKKITLHRRAMWVSILLLFLLTGFLFYVTWRFLLIMLSGSAYDSDFKVDGAVTAKSLTVSNSVYAPLISSQSLTVSQPKGTAAQIRLEEGPNSVVLSTSGDAGQRFLLSNGTSSLLVLDFVASSAPFSVVMSPDSSIPSFSISSSSHKSGGGASHAREFWRGVQHQSSSSSTGASMTGYSVQTSAAASVSPLPSGGFTFLGRYLTLGQSMYFDSVSREFAADRLRMLVGSFLLGSSETNISTRSFSLDVKNASVLSSSSFDFRLSEGYSSSSFFGVSLVSGAPAIFVNQSGSVGIGTRVPGSTLDVAGDLTVRGKLFVTNTVSDSGNFQYVVASSGMVTNAITGSANSDIVVKSAPGMGLQVVLAGPPAASSIFSVNDTLIVNSYQKSVSVNNQLTVSSLFSVSTLFSVSQPSNLVLVSGQFETVGSARFRTRSTFDAGFDASGLATISALETSSIRSTASNAPFVISADSGAVVINVSQSLDVGAGILYVSVPNKQVRIGNDSNSNLLIMGTMTIGGNLSVSGFTFMSNVTSTTITQSPIVETNLIRPLNLSTGVIQIESSAGTDVLVNLLPGSSGASGKFIVGNDALIVQSSPASVVARDLTVVGSLLVNGSTNFDQLSIISAVFVGSTGSYFKSADFLVMNASGSSRLLPGSVLTDILTPSSPSDLRFISATNRNITVDIQGTGRFVIASGLFMVSPSSRLLSFGQCGSSTTCADSADFDAVVVFRRLLDVRSTLLMNNSSIVFSTSGSVLNNSGIYYVFGSSTFSVDGNGLLLKNAGASSSLLPTSLSMVSTTSSSSFNASALSTPLVVSNAVLTDRITTSSSLLTIQPRATLLVALNDSSSAARFVVGDTMGLVVFQNRSVVIGGSAPSWLPEASALRVTGTSVFDGSVVAQGISLRNSSQFALNLTSSRISFGSSSTTWSSFSPEYLRLDSVSQNSVHTATSSTFSDALSGVVSSLESAGVSFTSSTDRSLLNASRLAFSGTSPDTVSLNRNGIVVYSAVGVVTVSPTVVSVAEGVMSSAISAGNVTTPVVLSPVIQSTNGSLSIVSAQGSDVIVNPGIAAASSGRFVIGNASVLSVNPGSRSLSFGLAGSSACLNCLTVGVSSSFLSSVNFSSDVYVSQNASVFVGLDGPVVTTISSGQISLRNGSISTVVSHGYVESAAVRATYSWTSDTVFAPLFRSFNGSNIVLQPDASSNLTVSLFDNSSSTFCVAQSGICRFRVFGSGGAVVVGSRQPSSFSLSSGRFLVDGTSVFGGDVYIEQGLVFSSNSSKLLFSDAVRTVSLSSAGFGATSSLTSSSLSETNLLIWTNSSSVMLSSSSLSMSDNNSRSSALSSSGLNVSSSSSSYTSLDGNGIVLFGSGSQSNVTALYVATDRLFSNSIMSRSTSDLSITSSPGRSVLVGFGGVLNVSASAAKVRIGSGVSNQIIMGSDVLEIGGGSVFDGVVRGQQFLAASRLSNYSSNLEDYRLTLLDMVLNISTIISSRSLVIAGSGSDSLAATSSMLVLTNQLHRAQLNASLLSFADTLQSVQVSVERVSATSSSSSAIFTFDGFSVHNIVTNRTMVANSLGVQTADVSSGRVSLLSSGSLQMSSNSSASSILNDSAVVFSGSNYSAVYGKETVLSSPGTNARISSSAVAISSATYASSLSAEGLSTAFIFSPGSRPLSLVPMTGMDVNVNLSSSLFTVYSGTRNLFSVDGNLHTIFVNGPISDSSLQNVSSVVSLTTVGDVLLEGSMFATGNVSLRSSSSRVSIGAVSGPLVEVSSEFLSFSFASDRLLASRFGLMVSATSGNSTISGAGISTPSVSSPLLTSNAAQGLTLQSSSSISVSFNRSSAFQINSALSLSYDALSRGILSIGTSDTVRVVIGNSTAFLSGPSFALSVGGNVSVMNGLFVGNSSLLESGSLTMSANSSRAQLTESALGLYSTSDSSYSQLLANRLVVSSTSSSTTVSADGLLVNKISPQSNRVLSVDLLSSLGIEFLFNASSMYSTFQLNDAFTVALFSRTIAFGSVNASVTSKFFGNVVISGSISISDSIYLNSTFVVGSQSANTTIQLDQIRLLTPRSHLSLTSEGISLGNVSSNLETLITASHISTASVMGSSFANLSIQAQPQTDIVLSSPSGRVVIGSSEFVVVDFRDNTTSRMRVGSADALAGLVNVSAGNEVFSVGGGVVVAGDLRSGGSVQLRGRDTVFFDVTNTDASGHSSLFSARLYNGSLLLREIGNGTVADETMLVTAREIRKGSMVLSPSGLVNVRLAAPSESDLVVSSAAGRSVFVVLAAKANANANVSATDSGVFDVGSGILVVNGTMQRVLVRGEVPSTLRNDGDVLRVNGSVAVDGSLRMSGSVVLLGDQGQSVVQVGSFGSGNGTRIDSSGLQIVQRITANLSSWSWYLAADARSVTVGDDASGRRTRLDSQSVETGTLFASAGQSLVLKSSADHDVVVSLVRNASESRFVIEGSSGVLLTANGSSGVVRIGGDLTDSGILLGGYNARFGVVGNVGVEGSIRVRDDVVIASAGGAVRVGANGTAGPSTSMVAGGLTVSVDGVVRANVSAAGISMLGSDGSTSAVSSSTVQVSTVRADTVIARNGTSGLVIAGGSAGDVTIDVVQNHSVAVGAGALRVWRDVSFANIKMSEDDMVRFTVGNVSGTSLYSATRHMVGISGSVLIGGDLQIGAAFSVNASSGIVSILSDTSVVSLSSSILAMTSSLSNQSIAVSASGLVLVSPQSIARLDSSALQISLVRGVDNSSLTLSTRNGGNVVVELGALTMDNNQGSLLVGDSLLTVSSTRSFVVGSMQKPVSSFFYGSTLFDGSVTFASAVQLGNASSLVFGSGSDYSRLDVSRALFVSGNHTSLLTNAALSFGEGNSTGTIVSNGLILTGVLSSFVNSSLDLRSVNGTISVSLGASGVFAVSGNSFSVNAVSKLISLSGGASGLHAFSSAADRLSVNGNILLQGEFISSGSARLVGASQVLSVEDASMNSSVVVSATGLRMSSNYSGGVYALSVLQADSLTIDTTIVSRTGVVTSKLSSPSGTDLLVQIPDSHVMKVAFGNGTVAGISGSFIVGADRLVVNETEGLVRVGQSSMNAGTYSVLRAHAFRVSGNSSFMDDSEVLGSLTLPSSGSVLRVGSNSSVTTDIKMSGIAVSGVDASGTIVRSFMGANGYSVVGASGSSSVLSSSGLVSSRVGPLSGSDFEIGMIQNATMKILLGNSSVGGGDFSILSGNNSLLSVSGYQNRIVIGHPLGSDANQASVLSVAGVSVFDGDVLLSHNMQLTASAGAITVGNVTSGVFSVVRPTFVRLTFGPTVGQLESGMLSFMSDGQSSSLNASLASVDTAAVMMIRNRNTSGLSILADSNTDVSVVLGTNSTFSVASNVLRAFQHSGVRSVVHVGRLMQGATLCVSNRSVCDSPIAGEEFAISVDGGLYASRTLRIGATVDVDGTLGSLSSTIGYNKTVMSAAGLVVADLNRSRSVVMDSASVIVRGPSDASLLTSTYLRTSTVIAAIGRNLTVVPSDLADVVVDLSSGTSRFIVGSEMIVSPSMSLVEIGSSGRIAGAVNLAVSGNATIRGGLQISSRVEIAEELRITDAYSSGVLSATAHRLLAQNSSGSASLSADGILVTAGGNGSLSTSVMAGVVSTATILGVTGSDLTVSSVTNTSLWLLSPSGRVVIGSSEFVVVDFRDNTTSRMRVGSADALAGLVNVSAGNEVFSVGGGVVVAGDLRSGGSVQLRGRDTVFFDVTNTDASGHSSLFSARLYNGSLLLREIGNGTVADETMLVTAREIRKGSMVLSPSGLVNVRLAAPSESDLVVSSAAGRSVFVVLAAKANANANVSATDSGVFDVGSGILVVNGTMQRVLVRGEVPSTLRNDGDVLRVNGSVAVDGSLRMSGSVVLLGDQGQSVVQVGSFGSGNGTRIDSSGLQIVQRITANLSSWSWYLAADARSVTVGDDASGRRTRLDSQSVETGTLFASAGQSLVLKSSADHDVVVSLVRNASESRFVIEGSSGVLLTANGSSGVVRIGGDLTDSGILLGGYNARFGVVGNVGVEGSIRVRDDVVIASAGGAVRVGANGTAGPSTSMVAGGLTVSVDGVVRANVSAAGISMLGSDGSTSAVSSSTVQVSTVRADTVIARNGTSGLVIAGGSAGDVTIDVVQNHSVAVGAGALRVWRDVSFANIKMSEDDMVRFTVGNVSGTSLYSATRHMVGISGSVLIGGDLQIGAAFSVNASSGIVAVVSAGDSLVLTSSGLSVASVPTAALLDVSSSALRFTNGNASTVVSSYAVSTARLTAPVNGSLSISSGSDVSVNFGSSSGFTVLSANQLYVNASVVSVARTVFDVDSANVSFGGFVYAPTGLQFGKGLYSSEPSSEFVMSSAGRSVSVTYGGISLSSSGLMSTLMLNSSALMFSLNNSFVRLSATSISTPAVFS
eukprot:ANDGO_04140.mRNA.1 hypothetical protein